MLEEPIKKKPKKPPLTREMVIEDMQRVGALIDHSQGFLLKMYLLSGGRYTTARVLKFGSWSSLCREAGYECAIAVKEKSPNHVPWKQQKLIGMRERLMSEIRRVGKMIDPTQGFTLKLFLQHSTGYTIGKVLKFGSWYTLCIEAGYQCSIQGRKSIPGGLPLTRQSVIEDIQRVGGGVDHTHGFALKAYVLNGGSYSPTTLFKFGSWRMLCIEAGYQCAIEGRQPRKDRPHVTREMVIEDIRRVAAMVDVSLGLSVKAYHENHGLYHPRTIRRIDTWKTLCQEADVKSWPKGGNVRRTTAPRLGGTLLDHKLYSENLERRDNTKSMIGRFYKGKPGRRPKKSMQFRAINEIHPEEIIADIRDIAMQIGLQSPSLLKWDLYRQHGGRYHFDIVLQHGGFETLRKEAA